MWSSSSVALLVAKAYGSFSGTSTIPALGAPQTRAGNTPGHKRADSHKNIFRVGSRAPPLSQAPPFGSIETVTVVLLVASSSICTALRHRLISDADDGVWLYTQCGLIHVPNTELDKWWRDSHAVVKVETFDVFDGARPWGTSFQPRASRSPDGHLWFANENVVQMINPNHLRANAIVPPVQVETLVADHKSYSLSPRVSLPALIRDLEIDYTALSFAVPQKVRFRYRLEGHEPKLAGTPNAASGLLQRSGPGTIPLPRDRMQ